MKKTKKIKFAAIWVLIFCLVAVFSGTPLIQVAKAGSDSTMSDTMSTLKAATASNHDIKFTATNGITAGTTLTIAFQAGFVMPVLHVYDIDLATNTPSGQVNLDIAASGKTWGVATSGQNIVFTNGSTNIASGTVIEIYVGTNATTGGTGTHQITNPAAGSYTITLSGKDSGTITVSVITDNTVTLSGTVNQSITFSLTGNTLTFGTLDTSAARFATTTSGSAASTTGSYLVAGTNAASGYTTTYLGDTLKYSSYSINAIGASRASSTPGTSQFGIRVTISGSGTGVVAAGYSNPKDWTFVANAATPIASASGATPSNTYAINYLANIAANTAAGSYSTTLTYVTSGNF